MKKKIAIFIFIFLIGVLTACKFTIVGTQNDSNTYSSTVSPELASKADTEEQEISQPLSRI